MFLNYSIWNMKFMHKNVKLKFWLIMELASARYNKSTAKYKIWRNANDKYYQLPEIIIDNRIHLIITEYQELK